MLEHLNTRTKTVQKTIGEASKADMLEVKAILLGSLFFKCDLAMGSAVEWGGPRSEAAEVHHDAKLGAHDILLGLEESVQHAIAGILLG